MNPTPEQAACVELFMQGEPLAIEAFAGAGKTSTLKLMADATRDRGQYVAFNKAIVVDSSRKFPDNVGCNTAHSLAMRAVGRNFRHRLDGGRQASSVTAQQMRMTPLVIRYGAESKVLQPGWMASHTMKSLRLFLNSADAEPGSHHVAWVDGLDLPDPDGGHSIGPNQMELRAHVLPFLRAAWSDVSRPDGQLPYSPDCYLKLWERTGPVISADFVLFDESQDASPVMLSIVQQQTHAQQVFVGDSFQQIYEWRGAVNALGNLGEDVSRAYLTQSFRFGPAIAGAANALLQLLEAPKALRGFDPIASRLERVAEPDAVLTRTNAKAVGTVMTMQAAGRRPALVGGGTEMAAFARGARDLQTTGSTYYHDLACFTSWQQVLEYVAQDPGGDELRLQVQLVEDFGSEAILSALERMPRQEDADVVVSTAHKAKGCEWPTVQLADDFFEPDEGETPSAGELRLMYVACTRAQEALDVSRSGWLADLFRVEPAGPEPTLGQTLL